MSSFLLWAQRQEICTSHPSESRMQEDSHSKYVYHRETWGKFELFVWGSCVNPYKDPTFILMRNEHLKTYVYFSHKQHNGLFLHLNSIFNGGGLSNVSVRRFYCENVFQFKHQTQYLILRWHRHPFFPLQLGNQKSTQYIPSSLFFLLSHQLFFFFTLRNAKCYEHLLSRSPCRFIQHLTLKGVCAGGNLQHHLLNFVLRLSLRSDEMFTSG